MSWTKRVLILGTFLAGLLLLGGHAWADSGTNASGNTLGTSALNGSPTVQADVCGNAVGVGGDPQASCGGDQDTATTSGGGGTTAQGSSGENDNVSGNTLGTSALNGSPTVQADVCGNAVGVGGDPQASCGGDQDTATGTEPPGGGVVEEPPGGGTEPPGGGTEPPGTGTEPPGDGGGTEPGTEPGGGGTEPTTGGVLPPTLGGDETPTAFAPAATGSAPVFAIGAGAGPALAFTGDHLKVFALIGLALMLLGAALVALGKPSTESEVI
jgi:hypothetical protein